MQIISYVKNVVRISVVHMILTTNIINIASSGREMFGVMNKVFDFELENYGFESNCSRFVLSINLFTWLYRRIIFKCNN